MNGLEPLLAHRLAEARAQAEEVVQLAREAAQRRRDAARAEVDELVKTAEHEGDASADMDTDRSWTVARRRARAIVLAAERAAYEELRGSVMAAVQADARYPGLLGRIVDDAHRRLGPGADVSVDGSVVTGSRRQRHVRWSLADTIETSLQHRAADVEELWR